MLGRSSTQRWCSLVLLSVLLSLTLYYGLPQMAYRLGRAVEAGRHAVRVESDLARMQASQHEQAEIVHRVTERIRPSVVRVEAVDAQDSPEPDVVAGAAGPRPADIEPRQSACGVVIDASGYLLTNYSPLAHRRLVRIFLQEGRPTVAGRLVGGDADTDLAVVRFEPPPDVRLSAARLSEARLPAAGDCVVAIGNAYRHEHWLWLGRISSGGRNLAAAACLPQDFIQTTAANVWNSGGPLVNLRGEIVGINTSWSGLDGNPAGMTVPVAVASQVAQQLRAHGHVTRGWLGLYLHSVHPVPQPGFPEGAVAVCVDYVVPESPAALAGIATGDLVLGIDGRPVASAGELRRKVAATAAATRLRLSVLRGGEQSAISLVVQPRPETAAMLPGEREWGIRPMCHVPEEARRNLGLDVGSGVVVERVAGNAWRAGIRPGDVVQAVDEAAVQTLADFGAAVARWRGAKSSAPVVLTISTDGVQRAVVYAP